MQGFNLHAIDLFQFTQSLQPIFFYRWLLVIFAIGYLLFHIIIRNQITSMDKVITQPLSSTILTFVSLILMLAGVALLILLLFIHI